MLKIFVFIYLIISLSQCNITHNEISRKDPSENLYESEQLNNFFNYFKSVGEIFFYIVCDDIFL